MSGCRLEMGGLADSLTGDRDDDSVTSRMVLEILEDEVEHEEDLEALLVDIQMMEKR